MPGGIRLRRGVVGLLILVQVYRGYASGLERRREELATAKDELEKLNQQMILGRLAGNKLARWREQSLPNTDPNDPESKEFAYQLYSAWLDQTLKSANITATKIEKVPRTAVVSTEIGTIGVTVEAPAELANVVNFLHRFYSSAQLHQISKLDLRKDPDGMKFAMQVEAMLLPGAANTDKLPDGKASPFTLASVNDYRTRIVDRNIFNPFVRPGRERDGGTQLPEGQVDPSTTAKFTGTTPSPKGLTAWVTVMATGDTILKNQDEEVQIGTWSSKVVSVEPRALVLEDAEGRQSRVELGTMLREGRSNRRGGRGGRGSRFQSA